MLFRELFLFPDAKQGVDQDAQHRGARDGGDIEAEHVDVAAKRVVDAQAEGDDHGDDRDVFGGEHAHTLVNHDRDALRRDGAEEVDFKPADDRLGDAVDHLDQRREAGDRHRDDAGSQHDGNRKHLGDGHGGNVLAVVGARGAANCA